MLKKLVINFLFFCSILVLGKSQAHEIDSFLLQRPDGSVLEGYFAPPATSESPIIFAIQGSSSMSAFEWYKNLSNQVGSLGLGLVVLEKQGISRDSFDAIEYDRTNSLQKRLEDYIFCLDNINTIDPVWNGKVIFWGESEGGMLAAALAAQTPETAAVLLFATGGGMSLLEEVKWALHHRLTMYGASSEEIEQYMSSLNDKIETILSDPNFEEKFLGNTYKWWASLLEAEGVVLSLTQSSAPIFLIHGVEDNQVPVFSADLVFQALQATNAVTYFRLEGYGHNLNHPEVQIAACQWLEAILFGGQFPDQSVIPAITPANPFPSIDWQEDILTYILTRGGSAYVEVNRDKEGHTSVSGTVIVSERTERGEVEVEVEVEVNNRGDVTCSGRVGYSW